MSRRILVLNNRDSFVFNLARYFNELGATTTVLDTHAVTVRDLEREDADALVISPGPGTPDAAGVSLDAIRSFRGRLPILGVCLGHQAIAQAFSWRVMRAKTPRYGRASNIQHSGAGLFTGLPNPLSAGLYHSLVVIPKDDGPLKVEAVSPSGEVMALSHRDAPVFGVQFHPESVLTECGHALLANFLDIVEEGAAR